MPIASVICRGASRGNSVLRTVGLLLLLAGPWGLSSGLRLEGGPWEVQRRDGGEETSLPWLDRALEALESATRFFENNYDRIILDGIFGLRVAEGQLVSALGYLEDNPEVSPAVRRRANWVGRLQERMHITGRAAIPFLLANNEKYVEVFSDMVFGPYVVSYNPRRVAPPMHKKASTSIPQPFYREKKGDACFADLMGQTLDDGKRAPPKCTISQACYHMMTDPGKTDYALTHQLLFVIQAQRSGCGTEIERLFKRRERLATFEKDKCDQIYAEATALSQGGQVQSHMQDLFLEQGVVCGMIGFESFLRPDWLKMIINWQSPAGCFTDDDDSYKPKQFRGRRLLYEAELEDGCLSHKSGLGISLLGIYVRYLIEHDGQFPNYLIA